MFPLSHGRDGCGRNGCGVTKPGPGSEERRQYPGRIYPDPGSGVYKKTLYYVESRTHIQQDVQGIPRVSESVFQGIFEYGVR